MHDHRQDREVEMTYTPEQFIRNLAMHVLNHYARAVRYLGLLAPRSRGRLFKGVFAVLGQTPRARPQHLSSTLSVKKAVHVDPSWTALANVCGGRAG